MIGLRTKTPAATELGKERPPSMEGAKQPPTELDNVLSPKDALDLVEKRRQNYISIVSVVVTFCIAVFSLLWNAKIQSQATQTSDVLETTRVVNDRVITNSNGGDFSHPWLPWQQPISPKTIYIGVQRTITFLRPFREKPDITLGLSLIDLPPMESVLGRLGYKPATPEDKERIRHFHVVTDSDNITRVDFVLQVGIGLPTESAKAILAALQRPVGGSPADLASIADMRIYKALEDRPGPLKPGEMWMVNFYHEIGTLAVTWMAQAPETRPNIR